MAGRLSYEKNHDPETCNSGSWFKYDGAEDMEQPSIGEPAKCVDEWRENKSR